MSLEVGDPLTAEELEEKEQLLEEVSEIYDLDLFALCWDYSFAYFKLVCWYIGVFFMD